MHKYAPLIFVFFIASFLTACGSGSTTAAIAIYDLPVPVTIDSANTHRLIGGAVQGTTLTLGNTVSTFTGTPGSATGFSNYSTVNGPPAAFNHPTDITTDGTDFYVSDYGNNAIRKVTASGEVTTLQCTTDGTASSTFYRPTGITTDGTNLFVVDSGTNTIRFIDMATRIVTIIGSTDSKAGSVDSIVPADARFNQPTGITTDGQNLYVADSGNHTIRRINIATKAVSTLAGTSGSTGSADGIQGAARFYLPSRITTDGVSLYVTDFYNRIIRKIDIGSGTVTTLAGVSGQLGSDRGATDSTDGTGSTARFNQPNGITTDGTYLYVTDSYLNSIRKIDKTSGNTTTIIPVDTLHTPLGITTDGVSLYVADTYIVIRDPKTYVDTYTYSNSIITVQ
ncbi:MAG: hypothetical protein PHR66_04860 [Desulfuromonadaceae bacterium]|nr:hypothetical protein [Desulfuromonadaceae bacterium]